MNRQLDKGYANELQLCTLINPPAMVLGDDRHTHTHTHTDTHTQWTETQDEHTEP